MRFTPVLPSPDAGTMRTACALAIALLVAGGAVAGDGAAPAADSAVPDVTFSGFGSLGLVHAGERQADFTSSILKSAGAGATRKLAYNLDSRIGGQLDAKLGRQWSAVLQVVVEQRYDRSYKPQVEWANIKYQATPDLALRFGRIALPIFLAADYRKVGYAYPWVRTPNEVYGGVPISNSDGVDLTYRWRTGGVKHSTQAFFGNNTIHLTDTTTSRARGIAGITHTAEQGAATFRVTAFTARLDTDIVRPLFTGFRQFGPRGVAIAEQYDAINKRTRGVALGVNYDPGQWFVMAEGGAMRSDSFFGKSVGLYASAGYRAGAFTPYVIYSTTDAKSPRSDPGLALAGLPPALAGAAAQLNAGLNTLLETRASQDNVGAGVRWDVRANMALKLQYERLKPGEGSRGTLINLRPGFRSGTPVHVTSAVLDVVF